MVWYQNSQEWLGTQIYLDYESPSDLSSLIWAEAERMEQKFSRFRDTSELSVFNKNLNTWHNIDTEWGYLLNLATKLKLQTDGALDVTVKSTLDSWGYNDQYSLQESGKASELGLFELEGNQFRSSAEIDFGSFGKGYFVDRVKQIFEESGVQNFFINAGGDLYGQGFDQDQKIWESFFEDPRNPELVIGNTGVDNLFLCSSSPLRRKWRDRHHLVKPQTKLPAEQMSAVYVQSKVSGAECDGLSTALFILGFEAAQSCVEQSDCEAMLIGASGEVWRSDGFKGELFTA